MRCHDGHGECCGSRPERRGKSSHDDSQWVLASAVAAGERSPWCQLLISELCQKMTRPAQKAVAEKIGKACEEIGFFVVVNHGIPADVIDAAWNQTMDFFDLPLDEKKKFVSEDEAKNPYGLFDLNLLAEREGQYLIYPATSPLLKINFRPSHVISWFQHLVFSAPQKPRFVPASPAKVIRCWVVNNSLEGKSWRMAVKASKWGT